MPNWVRLGLWPEDLRVGAPPAETSQMVRLYRPSLSLQARRLRHPPPKAVSSTRGQPGPGAVAEATDTEEIPEDFGLGMGKIIVGGSILILILQSVAFSNRSPCRQGPPLASGLFSTQTPGELHLQVNRLLA